MICLQGSGKSSQQTFTKTLYQTTYPIKVPTTTDMRSLTILVLLVGLLALLATITQAGQLYRIPIRLEKWCPANPLDKRCSGYISKVCPTNPGLMACKYYNLNQIQSLSDSQQLMMKTRTPGVKTTLRKKILCEIYPHDPMCKRHVRPLSDIPWRRRL